MPPSAMPPERMTEMAQLPRGYAQTATENVAPWHERDISHSTAERVILPDANIAGHDMVVRVCSSASKSTPTEANLQSTDGRRLDRCVPQAADHTGGRQVAHDAPHAWLR